MHGPAASWRRIAEKLSCRTSDVVQTARTFAHLWPIYVDPVAAHVFGFKLKNRHNTAWHRHEKVNYTLKGPTQTNIMQRIG